MTKAKSFRIAQDIEAFNRENPPGTRMTYKSHPDAEGREVLVRSNAWLLGGHTPCVMVEGVRGAVGLFALSHQPAATR